MKREMCVFIHSLNKTYIYLFKSFLLFQFYRSIRDNYYLLVLQ